MALGGGLRLALMLAYRPGFVGYFDTPVYVTGAQGDLFWDPLRPAGYPLFMRIAHGLDANLSFTIVVQHGLGVATALLAYATLRRIGAPPALGLVPAAAVLLAGDQIFLEHALLSESVYTFLTAAGVYAAACCLDARRAAPWAAAAGLLLAMAAVVRLAGLPLLALAVVWLLAAPRRPWRGRALLAGAAAAVAAVVLGGYLTAAHDQTGQWSFARNGAYNLYGRAATFADCDEFDPPRGTGVLCESTPASKRPTAQYYVFEGPAPAHFGEPQIGDPDRDDVEALGRFARRAAWAQPLGWVEASARDFVRYVAPERNRGPRPTPSTEDYVETFLTIPDRVPRHVAQAAGYYSTEGGPFVRRGLYDALRDYARAARIEGTPLAILLVLTLAAPLACRGRERRGALLVGGVGIALLAVPVATLNYDGRFAVPSYAFLAGAAALGARGLVVRARGRRRGPAAAAAAACCVLLAGCGSDERRLLDTRKVERGVERGVERDRPGVRVTVSCPDDVELEKGRSFKCRVVGSNGQEADATVTQVDDQGRVKYEVPPP